MGQYVALFLVLRIEPPHPSPLAPRPSPRQPRCDVASSLSTYAQKIGHGFEEGSRELFMVSAPREVGLRIPPNHLIDETDTMWLVGVTRERDKRAAIDVGSEVILRGLKAADMNGVDAVCHTLPDGE